MGSLPNKFYSFRQNDKVLPCDLIQDIENTDNPVSIQKTSSLGSETL